MTQIAESVWPNLDPFLYFFVGLQLSLTPLTPGEWLLQLCHISTIHGPYLHFVWSIPGSHNTCCILQKWLIKFGTTSGSYNQIPSLAQFMNLRKHLAGPHCIRQMAPQVLKVAQISPKCFIYRSGPQNYIVQFKPKQMCFMGSRGHIQPKMNQWKDFESIPANLQFWNEAN